MKKEAENFLQSEAGDEDLAPAVKNVILTYPDHFRPRQKNLLKRACKEAGFARERITLFSRAHAAIVAFNLNQRSPLKVLIVHVGALSSTVTLCVNNIES